MSQRLPELWAEMSGQQLPVAQRPGFAVGRDAYLSPGPMLQPHDLKPEDLETSYTNLITIAHHLPFELAGWTQVEALTTEQSADQLDIRYDQAAQVFGAACTLAERTGARHVLPRLALAQAAMPVYSRILLGQELPVDEHTAYIKSLCHVGEQLLDPDNFLLAGNSKASKNAETIERESRFQKGQLAVLLALNTRSYDARKPIPTIALPATMRQQRANTPDPSRRKPRVRNWSVSVFDRIPHAGWDLKHRLHSVEELDDNCVPDPDVTIISPAEHLRTNDGTDQLEAVLHGLMSSITLPKASPLKPNSKKLAQQVRLRLSNAMQNHQ